LLALYGFFRLVDYAGDEAPGHRDTLLDLLDADLKRVYQGTPRIPLLRGLVPTVRECGLPRELLVRLIDGNRQDQRVSRYEKFEDLCDYCALSANPVGEAVLYVFGRAEPKLIERSDKICTALQILEHCQDVAQDYEQGRIYLPAEDMRRFQCAEEDLLQRSAPTKLRGLIRFEVQRARKMLDEGSVLVKALSGVGRVAVAGYVAGGVATARAFTAARYDPLGVEVRPDRVHTAADWARLWLAGGTR
jgi:squalene synthase HpnC